MNLNRADKLELIKGENISLLCNKFGIFDEFEMLDAVAELMYSGEAFLVGFEKIFR